MSPVAMSKGKSKITNRPTRLAGADNRGSLVRRRKDLINGYTGAFGGADQIATTVMADIVRAAELSLICEETRARAFQGHEIDIENLARLEGTRDRAVRRLNIKPPRGASAPAWSPLMSRHGGAV
jgi:hypothetical protein